MIILNSKKFSPLTREAVCTNTPISTYPVWVCPFPSMLASIKLSPFFQISQVKKSICYGLFNIPLITGKAFFSNVYQSFFSIKIRSIFPLFFLSGVLYFLLHKISLYTKNVNPLYVIQISFPKSWSFFLWVGLYHILSSTKLCAFEGYVSILLSPRPLGFPSSFEMYPNPKIYQNIIHRSSEDGSPLESIRNRAG